MLKLEIQPYVDEFGLVSNAKVTNKQGRASDNGVMFLSEYLIMLIRNKEAVFFDIDNFLNTIDACMVRPGLLSRAPGDPDQEGPDDYIGLAAALCEIQREYSDWTQSDRARELARSIVKYGFLHLTLMNNENPGKWSLSAFLARQPQLIAAYLWAAGYPVGPFLRLYCAIVILFAAKGKQANDADPRRLSWLLVQIAAPRSWICRMASIVWYRRLYKAYPNGMKDVAAVYYEAGHPFARYWIDKP